jgi:hypothetical protein
MRGGDMGDKPILVVRATGLHESVSFAQQLFDYVFRGQANAHWELNTRMERVCWQTQFPTTFLRNREYAILRAFQRRLNIFQTIGPGVE